MKREIKFRGKRLDNGEWIVGSYIEAENRDRSIAHQIVPYEAGGIVRDVNPDTIGQYTKVKDNKGVEIYEGDILRIYYDNHDSGITTVRSFGKIDYYTDCSDYAILAWLSPDLCEIVGNIYDNPELLKGGKL